MPERPLRGSAVKQAKSTPPVLASWPVIVALGLVVLLVAGTIVLDLHFARQVALKTGDIFEDAQRSIILLKDIRFAAKRLASAADGGEVERWRAEIDERGHLYDPIASYTGERAEWHHLRDLLRRLPAHAADPARARALEVAIDKSIDDLVAINAAAGQGNASAIRAARRQEVISDVLVGISVLATVGLIAGWLLRVLARQRRLVLERVRLLDEKNAELEAFAGRAAHDLRSPLNPIRGYADLLLETPGLSETAATMVQRIRRSVDRMARVVDDMLALSVSGRPPEGRSNSTLAIQRILEEMGPELADVEVVTRLEAGIVACAEGVLFQILRNLIGNAIKFRARTRPLRIAITTRDAGDRVELCVEDNGVGMDGESAKQAFAPFFRGTPDREVPGHGLGLAIVERTTRALGGSCDLSSVPDHSTRIVVRLPRTA
jgi:signal transduction histidine kinase